MDKRGVKVSINQINSHKNIPLYCQGAVKLFQCQWEFWANVKQYK